MKPKKIDKRMCLTMKHATADSAQNVSDLEEINTNCCTIITGEHKVHYTFCCNILSQMKHNKPFTANIVLSDKVSFISPDKLTDITFEYRGALIHMQ